MKAVRLEFHATICVFMTNGRGMIIPSMFLSAKLLLIISLSVGMLFVLHCTTNDRGTRPAENLALEIAQPTPEPNYPSSTPTLENKSLADKSPQYLCDHLLDLKHMASREEYSGDAVYDALKRHGYYSTPCLIKKITDTRPAQNPTGAPFWAGLTYRVSDTAVLMLMDIHDMYWPKGMLPKKYEDMFEAEGMFSYYYYVDEVPGARKKVQRWWSQWMKTCQPECSVVPSIEKKKN